MALLQWVIAPRMHVGPSDICMLRRMHGQELGSSPARRFAMGLGRL